MKRTVLSFGFISGLIAAVLMTITALLIKSNGHGEFNLIYGYTGIILSLILVFFGIRSYRQNVGNGTISFGRAFYVGILIALISSVCYVIAWLIVSSIFLPDFADNYVQDQIQKLNESGLSPAEIAEKTDQYLKQGEMMKNPLTNALMVFMEPFPVGILITLISAVILKKKPSASKQ